MPYAANSELPPNVQKMSKVKQDAFRRAFNAAHAEGKDEGTCFAIAYAAAKSVSEAVAPLGDTWVVINRKTGEVIARDIPTLDEAWALMKAKGEQSC